MFVSMVADQNYLRENGEHPPNVSLKKSEDAVRYRAGAGAPACVSLVALCGRQQLQQEVSVLYLKNAGTVLGPLRIVWKTTAARVVRVIYPEPSRSEVGY